MTVRGQGHLPKCRVWVSKQQNFRTVPLCPSGNWCFGGLTMQFFPTFWHSHRFFHCGTQTLCNSRYFGYSSSILGFVPFGNEGGEGFSWSVAHWQTQKCPELFSHTVSVPARVSLSCSLPGPSRGFWSTCGAVGCPSTS